MQFIKVANYKCLTKYKKKSKQQIIIQIIIEKNIKNQKKIKKKINNNRQKIKIKKEGKNIRN